MTNQPVNREFSAISEALLNGKGVLICRPLTEIPVTDDEIALLSAEEKERRLSFRLPEAAQAFTAGRVLLRGLLCLCLQEEEPRLETGPHGKPFCPHPQAPEFNLSHGGKWLAVALHPNTPVGVDVESLDRRASIHDLSERYFSPAEQVKVSENGADAFFRIWTRKEALLKATGEGLTRNLRELDTLREEENRDWVCQTYALPERHVLSLAHPAPEQPFERFGFTPGAADR